jgi:hypothetical protein
MGPCLSWRVSEGPNLAGLRQACIRFLAIEFALDQFSVKKESENQHKLQKQSI